MLVVGVRQGCGTSRLLLNASHQWDIIPVATVISWVQKHTQVHIVVAIVISLLSGSQDSFQVEPIGEPLARDLREDELVVVVAQCTSHFVVVHVGSVLALAPFSGYFFWIDHPELSPHAFPSDTGSIGVIPQ